MTSRSLIERSKISSNRNHSNSKNDLSLPNLHFFSSTPTLDGWRPQERGWSEAPKKGGSVRVAGTLDAVRRVRG
jgi:hypothetical protein